MKIIFLDIDGVLNCSSHRREMLLKGDYSVIIEQQQLVRLRRIVESTHASIVLISSWRRFWMPTGSIDSAGKRIETALHSIGLSVMDKTPVLNDGTRGQEVEQWLKSRSTIDQYVILDDSDFAWSKKLRAHWVQCPDETGLTDLLVDSAIDVLNGNLLPVCDTNADKSKGGLRNLWKRIVRSRTEETD